MDSVPMYQIQNHQGKGRGLMARRNITRGERIICESPMFTFPNIEDTMPTSNVIGPKVEALEPTQRQIFYGLYNNFNYHGTPASIGIIKTNALRVNRRTDAVFPTFSLINHCCVPNASYSWNDNLMRGTLHAIDNISAGEEITIAYGDHRRGSGGGFICICELCSTSSRAALIRSDARREEMVALEGQVWRHWGRDPEPFFRKCRELQTLMLTEYVRCPSPALASLYELAAEFAATHSDGGRVMGFARWAYSVRFICEGPDNPETQRCQGWMEDPLTHPRWGITQWWGAQLQRPPTNLSEREYEAWLWRWGR